ncbi:hypothetical protein HBI37_231380 [Parastagonospora nodorum]|nr:hypothetical protein HBI37_231380 [Parastagonospora nodorum]KAH6335792.1 hypothetical protein HBI36_229760 [Parastagonospora nodorum]
MTLTSDKYETLYAEVEREMRERAILCQSLRTTTAKEHIRQIARVVASRQNSSLQSTAPDSRLRTITHLAVRCNHNATRRMRSERRKMRCNYNPKTGLQNNDGYAEAVVYSAGQSNTFIQTLEREVRFEDKRSGIYYYTKTADSWTRIRISIEARWHSALQDTVATKLYRATFVIELLI